MKLELGVTYTVLKADKTIVTFKFIGDYNGQPHGEVDENNLPLVEILSGGIISYWETK